MGITFATYGIDEGPYLIAPVLGPTNPRDIVGNVADSFIDPGNYFAGKYDIWYAPLARTAVSGIDVRSRNIEALADIEKTSLDFYATIRSLYRQRRAAEIRHEEFRTCQIRNSSRAARARHTQRFRHSSPTHHLQGGFRQMIRRRAAIVLFALGLLGLAAPRQAAAEDPRDFVNSLGEQAIQVLGPSVPPAQRLSRFRELFSTDFDVAGIGRFVLGRYWRTATPQEQQEFLGTVPGVCRARLFRPPRRVWRRAVPRHRHPPERRGNRRQQRNRARQRSDRPRLVPRSITAGGYKITDVYVAGVSMKVTQRDEFAAVIQRSGGQVAGLLSQLRQKLAAN